MPEHKKIPPKVHFIPVAGKKIQNCSCTKMEVYTTINFSRHINLHYFFSAAMSLKIKITAKVDSLILLHLFRGTNTGTNTI